MTKQIMALFMSIIMSLGALGLDVTPSDTATVEEKQVETTTEAVSDEVDVAEEMTKEETEENAKGVEPEQKATVKKKSRKEKKVKRRREDSDNTTQEVAIDGSSLIKSVTVTQNNKEVKDGSIVSYKENFSMEYQLKDGIKIGYGTGGDVETGKYYKLPELDTNFFKLNGERIIPIRIEGKEETFGDAYIQEDGSVLLHVTYAPDGREEVNGANFEYHAQLVEDRVKTEKNEITIPWPDGSTKRILIAENQPKEPTITKTGVVEGDKVNWTITITNDENPIEYDGGILVTDTIEMNGTGTHNYVEGSLQVNGEVKNPGDWTVSGKTFTYEVTSMEPGAQTVITYSTKAKFLATAEDLAQNGDLSQTVTNTAVITAEGEKALDKKAEATVTLKKTLDNWITKECTSAGKKIEYLTAEKKGKLSWTITVKNNGYSVKNVILHDLFGGDDFVKKHMTLAEESVKVAGKTAEVKTGEAGESFQIALPDMTGEETVVITYDTYISSYDEFLRTNHSVGPSNKSWLSFEFDFDGNGEYTVIPKGPEMIENVAITTKAGIEKKFVSFDPVKHQLKWRVTLNKEYQPLGGVSLKEILGNGQKFVSFGKMTMTEEGGSENEYDITESDYTEADGVVTLTLGDKIENKKATFEVVTELTDEEVDTWSGNVVAKVYSNQIALLSDGVEIAKDSANGTYTSEVIKKEVSAYDYTNHTIAYTIIVNQNKMPMDGVKIVDSWKGSSVKAVLVESSVKLDGTTLSTDQMEYKKADSTVTFSLGAINNEVKITYVLKVEDNDLFETNDAIKVSNEAAFTSAAKKTAVKVTGNCSFNGKFLDKTYTFEKNIGIVNYQVVVNANHHKLTEKLALLDTMGDGLRYVKESFVAYKGTVDKDGNVTKGEAVSEIEATAEKGKTSTNLTILFPNMGDDNCYVLTYQAKAVPKKTNYANTIVRVGRKSAEKSVASTKALSEADKSGAWVQKASYLTIKEKDNVDKQPIKGVIYGVKNAEGEEVTEQTSDGKQDTEVIGELDTGEEYTVYVKEVPAGYKMPEESEKKVTIEQLGKSNGKTVEFEFVREENVIKIQTISEEQKEPLEGAKIVLKEQGKNKTIQEWTTDGQEIVLEVPLKKEMVLVETVSPNGFEKEKEIHFKLDYEDGQVKLFVKQGDEFKPQSGQSLKLVNKTDETVKKEIEFVAVDDATGEEINGGEYILYPYTEEEAKQIIKNWTKGEDKELLEFNYQRIYEVKETNPPAGYEKAEKKIVKMDNQGDLWELTDDGFVKTTDNKVTMRNKRKSATGGGGSNGGGSTPSGNPGTTSDVPEQENTESEQPGTTQETTPSETTNPDAKTSSNKENKNETEAEDTKVKEKKSSVSKDSIKSKKLSTPKKKANRKEKQAKKSAGAPRLAQTGGFLGTLASYGLALLLLAIGCVLMRKESKK